ncbi:MAG: hypothetical protein KatS3mg118_1637 [Paracoccaceae bacterium]|nr:MAG: hypothetical protein KatS3mg118_1637 [Paracoccaceae bacterium]
MVWSAWSRFASNKEEQAMFDRSVAAVKGLVEACKAIDPALA